MGHTNIYTYKVPPRLKDFVPNQYQYTVTKTWNKQPPFTS